MAVYVVFGWLEHTLDQLPGIATRTAEKETADVTQGGPTPVGAPASMQARALTSMSST